MGPARLTVSRSELELLNLCTERTVAELRACAPSEPKPQQPDLPARIVGLRRRGLLTYAAAPPSGDLR